VSWNNVIPAWLWGPQTPCKVCSHRWSNHRDDVGCVGPLDPSQDSESFYKGTCKFGCKKYCETNLDFLEYKYEQKNKQ
jgi:hypothetical protein